MKQFSPIPFDQIELDELLELNQLRTANPSQRSHGLEERFASLFAVDRHLAVYGSLAPGHVNHNQLRPLSGEWFSGYSVRGELFHHGWGDNLGYPALRWSLDASLVPIQLFVSEELPMHWARLDQFEGVDYLRIVVPVHAEDHIVALANVYAARL